MYCTYGYSCCNDDFLTDRYVPTYYISLRRCTLKALSNFTSILQHVGQARVLVGHVIIIVKCLLAREVATDAITNKVPRHPHIIILGLSRLTTRQHVLARKNRTVFFN